MGKKKNPKEIMMNRSNKVGRKIASTDLLHNEKIINKIMECKKQGMTDKDAATYAGIGVSTMAQWKEFGRAYEKFGYEEYKPYNDFLKRYEHASLKMKEKALKTIERSIEIDKNPKTAQWYLERKYRDEYGQDLQKQGGLSGNMNIKIEKVYVNNDGEKENKEDVVEAEIVDDN